MLESSQTIRVRYNECDPMGIAHHAAYPIWFEMGRTESCRAAGCSYRELEASGTAIAVTRLEIRYRRPVRYDDLLDVVTRVERATRVKIEHSYEIRVDGVVTTEASTTVACVNRDGRPVAMPSILRAALGVDSD